jgi:transposase
VSEVEVIDRVERRRKWSEAEKAALLAEVEAVGGKVALVARRHRISESLLYNWRAAVRAAASTRPTVEPVEFVPIGVFGHAEDDGPAMLAAPAPSMPEAPPPTRPSGPSMDQRAGLIEIDLPSGVRIRVDAFVNERALRRVFVAVKDAL